MLVKAVPNTLNSSSLGVVPSWLKENDPSTFARRTEASSTSIQCASTSRSFTTCVVEEGSASAIWGWAAAAPPAAVAAPSASKAEPATPPAILRVVLKAMASSYSLCSSDFAASTFGGTSDAVSSTVVSSGLGSLSLALNMTVCVS